MKPDINSHFSLYSLENYKKTIDYSYTEIGDKYIKLEIDYLKYILENL